MATFLAALVFGSLLLGTLIGFGLTIAFPWALLCGFMFLAYVAGKKSEKIFGIRQLRFAAPVTAAIAGVIWLLSAYSAFEANCSTIVAPELLRKASSRQPGFLMSDQYLRQFQNEKEVKIAQQLLLQRRISYYDYFARRFDPQAEVSQVVRNRLEFGDKSATPPSEYSFYVSPVKPIPNQWFWPLYRVEYSVVSRRTSEPISVGSEVVLGGGLVGLYIQALKGERGDTDKRDYQYLACGYASKRPDAWRPHFSTNSNYQNYLQADTAMLQSILQ